jgi:hypothetical protein
MSRFESFRKVYGSLALVLLNTCLLLVILNAALFLFFRVLDGRRGCGAG